MLKSIKIALAVVGMAGWFWTSHAYDDDIARMPKTPVPERRMTVPLIDHGRTVYVTQQESDALNLAMALFFSLIVLAASLELYENRKSALWR